MIFYLWLGKTTEAISITYSYLKTKYYRTNLFNQYRKEKKADVLSILRSIKLAPYWLKAKVSVIAWSF